jgi:hypothetical protein
VLIDQLVQMARSGFTCAVLAEGQDLARPSASSPLQAPSTRAT